MIMVRLNNRPPRQHSDADTFNVYEGVLYVERHNDPNDPNVRLNPRTALAAYAPGHWIDVEVVRGEDA